jgi:hypothetical protein
MIFYKMICTHIFYHYAIITESKEHQRTRRGENLNGSREELVEDDD